jgi:hypothetical protein
MPSFGGEVKPSVPCKRSLQWRGSRHCRQNYRTFLAHSSPFPSRGLLFRCRRGGAWRRKWELPKHRVSTISLQAAVHSCGGCRRGPIERRRSFLLASPRVEICVRNFNTMGYIEGRRLVGREREVVRCSGQGY